ncbi:MAG: hypothetical protein JEZ03_09615 [Bacteroidales bacterium]|nr:hypothetical protein [Bacteroidales bacterium]
MKRLTGIFICSIFMVLGSSIFAQNSNTNNYENEWKKTETFIKQGLPQSAMEVVDGIYQDSRQSDNQAQLLKAFMYRIRLISDFEEDYMEKIITQIDQDIKDAVQPAKSVLHSIKAELLYSYLHSNRYNILNRMEMEQMTSNDIKTWTLNQFQKSIRSHYLHSIQEKEILCQTALSDFDLLLDKHKNTIHYYSSLYDLLARRLINALADDALDVEFHPFGSDIDQKDCFQQGEGFLNYQLIEDLQSNSYIVLKTFQDLISIHIKDGNEDALIDLEIKRIHWLKQVSKNPDRNREYLNFLIQLIAQYPNNKEVSRAFYFIAEYYHTHSDKFAREISKNHENDLLEAMKWCDAVIEKFPDSHGTLQCAQLKNTMLSPSLFIEKPRAIQVDQSTTAMLSYQNMDSIYLKIVENEQLLINQNYDVRENRWNALIKNRSVKTWAIALENPGDYRMHHMQIALPKLKPGHYNLLISKNKDFTWDNNIVGEDELWVTNLAFTKRDEGQNLMVRIVDRTKGLPISDANIKVWNRNYDRKLRNYSYALAKEIKTDSEGTAVVEKLSNESYGSSYVFEILTDNDRFVSDDFYHYRRSDRIEKWSDHGSLFTDRSIYRPGQTIYFKGFLYKNKGKEVAIRANTLDQIKLYDANNKELAIEDLKSNEFGTYQGSFILPQSLLNGQFHIRSKNGSTYIRVEEYKRPQFEVLVDTLKGQYEIGDSILVEGMAKAFAGYGISDAKVNYRVSMQTHRIKPYYWRQPNIQPEITISSGTMNTDQRGRYKLKFKAHQYPDMDPDSKIKHVYTIYVDVTDINGESQSNQGRVSIGGPALLLDVKMPERIDIHDALSFEIQSVNTEDQVEISTGSIEIYKLKEENRVLRPYSFHQRADIFTKTKEEFIKEFPLDVYSTEDDAHELDLGKQVYKQQYNTAKSKILDLTKATEWKAGLYRLIIQTSDKKGKKVSTEKQFTVFDSQSNQIPGKMLFWVQELKTTAEAGESAKILIGSSLQTTFLYELEHEGVIIHSETITLKNKQQQIEIPIKEEYRGDVFVHLIAVVENRILEETIRIKVPYSNKKLDVTLSTFRNKITPGANEEWSLSIKNYKNQSPEAEVMACMYDVSLDQFAPHFWNMNLYSQNFSLLSWDRDLSFIINSIHDVNNIKTKDIIIPQRIYPSLNWFGFRMIGTYGHIRGMKSKAVAMNVEDELMIMGEESDLEAIVVEEEEIFMIDKKPESVETETKPQPRRDFRETAFFFPQLNTNKEGDVVFKFKTPEALTRWKFMALAHTKDLEYGSLVRDDIVSSKDLMVVPNAPRFFREGDQMSFQAKVVNLSDHELRAEVKLEFFDAVNMQPVTEQILTKNEVKAISVKAQQSNSVEFGIQIPEGMIGLTYRITASTDAFSDGEEKIIPVLPNRMLVTETLPLWANTNESRSFELDNLLQSNKAKGKLQHYKLTLEMTSNPIWYAVQSLPYLMEYPHECNEQIFSRYYANALASHISNSNPEIRRIFEIWKDYQPEALTSALEKNQELKNIILESSPWVQQAASETDQKRRISLLFDMIRMSGQKQLAQEQLKENQLVSGAWSWFGKKWPSRYITTHIVTGFAKLNHLGVVDLKKDYQLNNMLIKAQKYLDQEMNTSYEWLLEHHKDMDAYEPSSMDVLYLYMRSFNNQTNKIDAKYQTAYNFYFKQTQKFWLKTNKYQQGMIAICMKRSANEKLAQQIISSLKEHALVKEELGMTWRDFESGGMFWSQAKIESQAMMIEAFEEVTNDRKSVDEMQKWLLKHKQTNNWGTTKATVEALYALLIEGGDQLTETNLVGVKLGGKSVEISPTQIEAGTGYFKTSWDKDDIKPKMAKVEINNPNNHAIWGGLYWQYYQDLEFIKKQNTSLSIEKELFVERSSDSGPIIKPVKEEEIRIGDKMIIRVIIRTDRDMEYVHLQDMRASGLEPMETLSGYKYTDGLWYYQSTRDASANFFFDQLPRGTYVFEYPLRVSQKGDFSNGISSIQCMYAPEFSAHSKGDRIKFE